MRVLRLAVPIPALVFAAVAAAALSPELERSLKESKYVYVQSERKSGALGKPAEIWFFYDAGTVYVASPPTAWRVRRIKAGRRKARIAVGKPDGPSFAANGRTLHDPALVDRRPLPPPSAGHAGARRDARPRRVSHRRDARGGRSRDPRRRRRARRVPRWPAPRVLPGKVPPAEGGMSRTAPGCLRRASHSG